MEDLGLSFSNVHLNNFPSAKLKVDELFNEWLAFEGGAALCSILFEAASASTSDSENEHGEQARSSSSQSAMLPRAALNSFKSPKKRTQSEMANRPADILTNGTPPKESPAAAATPAAAIAFEAGSDTSDDDHSVKGRRANFDKVPVFYVPGKKNNHLRVISDDDLLSKRLPEIEAFFKPFPAGIPIEKFVHVTKRLCGIPSFFNLPLCKRINERFGDADAGIPPPRTIGRSGRHPSGVKIKLKAFLKFWQAEVEPYDRIERFFRVIKRHDAEYIYKDDFIPFLQELLHFHPGLDFLEAHEEFQRKYALTVITRIFYTVNTSRSGKLSLREVRNSNLFNACMHVDEETDINRVVEYFSYEHFYVLYCKFFELDMDKDSKLTRADLVKYGEHSLSDAIVDRIFQVGTRVFSDGQVGGFEESGMTYPDFIFFMLSEEDKSSHCALRYWFSCCDLDGDGALSPEEMRHFYKNQILRVTNLGQESIHFQDVLCQMIDMVAPKNPLAITLEDMVKPNKRMICGVLFDILFNLHKFMRFETRDPFQEKLRREDVHRSDWDRYAHIEYNRLAQEEEGYDNSMEMDLQQYMDSSEGSGGGGGAGGGAEGGADTPAAGEGAQSWALSDESDDDDDLVYTSK